MLPFDIPRLLAFLVYYFHNDCVAHPFASRTRETERKISRYSEEDAVLMIIYFAKNSRTAAHDNHARAERGTKMPNTLGGLGRET